MASANNPFVHRIPFPAELVDSVIDHNHDDPATLKICALVSRQWTSSSRFHLFGKVIITHDNAREFIELLSSPHCTVASPVRDLTIQLVPGSQRWFSEFSRRLSFLGKTSNITALGIPGSRGTLIREEVQTALLAFSEQVKSLSFGPLVFESFKEFASLIRAFHTLESLSCACTFQTEAMDQEEMREYHLELVGTLRQIELISPSTKPVLEFLLRQQDGGGFPVLPTVANLSLSYLTDEDYPSLAKYLETSNDNLQSLAVRMNLNFSGANLDAFTENLKLTKLRALQTLSIDAAPALTPNQAFHLLAQISSTQFASLQISVALEQGIARLDILLSSDQFPVLHKVKIFRSSWDDIRQFFPRCDLKGILREN